MPLRHAPIASSTSNDVDSSDLVSINNPQRQILDITAQSKFYILTSLLWIRRPEQNVGQEYQADDAFAASTCKTDINSITVNEWQPDLGLLQYHRDRLVAAIDALQWRHIRGLDNSATGLKTLNSAIAEYLQRLPKLPQDCLERLKLRIMIYKSGVVAIDSSRIDNLLLLESNSLDYNFFPIPLDLGVSGECPAQMSEDLFRRHSLCQVYIDSTPTSPSLFTAHKTSYREQYDAARLRAMITTYAPTDNEVLIYNKDGEVMEASLCTVYFSRNGAWITPAATCGGNLGVTRRLAMEKGLCEQGCINIAELQDNEIIWLSNGVRGFFMGRIRL